MSGTDAIKDASLPQGMPAWSWDQLSPLFSVQTVKELATDIGTFANTFHDISGGTKKTWQIIAPSISLVTDLVKVSKSPSAKDFNALASKLVEGDPLRKLLEQAATALNGAGGMALAAGGSKLLVGLAITSLIATVAI